MPAGNERSAAEGRRGKHEEKRPEDVRAALAEQHDAPCMRELCARPRGSQRLLHLAHIPQQLLPHRVEPVGVLVDAADRRHRPDGGGHHDGVSRVERLRPLAVEAHLLVCWCGCCCCVGGGGAAAVLVRVLLPVVSLLTKTFVAD